MMLLRVLIKLIPMEVLCSCEAIRSIATKQQTSRKFKDARNFIKTRDYLENVDACLWDSRD